VKVGFARSQGEKRLARRDDQTLRMRFSLGQGLRHAIVEVRLGEAQDVAGCNTPGFAEYFCS